MSIWLHITGSIRFDSMLEDSEAEKEKIKLIMGNTTGFDDDEEVWELCNVPNGSEGSVQYSIVDVAPPEASAHGFEIHHLARWVVVIYGDLRNVEDFEQIEKWIKDIAKRCNEYNGSIRQGVIQGLIGDNSKNWNI